MIMAELQPRLGGSVIPERPGDGDQTFSGGFRTTATRAILCLVQEPCPRLPTPGTLYLTAPPRLLPSPTSPQPSSPSHRATVPRSTHHIVPLLLAAPAPTTHYIVPQHPSLAAPPSSQHRPQLHVLFPPPPSTSPSHNMLNITQHPHNPSSSSHIASSSCWE